MIRTRNSKRTFPLKKLPYDVIETIIRFCITNTSSTLTGSQLIYVNRLFAKISIPQLWKHLYLREPEQRIIFDTLSTSPENLMFDYKSLVRRITICPVSMSSMKGGLLKTLEIIRNLFSSHPLVGISIDDKLSFCHAFHVGKETSHKQVAEELIYWKGLKEFSLDSDHSAFDDDLLGELIPNFAPFIDKRKGIHGGLQKLSLSGSNFTDAGILHHVIPYVKDTLIEFNAGYGGANQTDNITSFSIFELLKNCKKLERMYLEGVTLNDSDFVIKHPTMMEEDEAYCDELLDDNLSDFDEDYESSTNNSPNNSLIITHPPPSPQTIFANFTNLTNLTNLTQEMTVQLKHLYVGKTKKTNQSNQPNQPNQSNQSQFTHKGLYSLLSLCNKSLETLVVDLDYISETVILDVFIPLFTCSKLQEIHLVSESGHEWASHYPRPRYELEVKAKEAMWRWKLKVYWGLSKELIDEVGDKIESLQVFSVLGENYLKKDRRGK